METSPPASRYGEQAPSWAGADALWAHRAGEAVGSLIPADACADLIVKVGERGTVLAAVHLPTAVALSVHVAEGESVFGVRLRPGYGMLAVAQATDLASRATALSRHGVELASLEALVAESLHPRGGPPSLVHEFLAFVRETHGTLGLSERRDLTTAERSLQRAAQQWLGMSPKRFMRIARARSAQVAICEGRSLAAVAAEFRFADQAHLTREFRTLLGRTPGQVRHDGIVQDAASAVGSLTATQGGPP